MKKILVIFTFVAALAMGCSCGKEKSADEEAVFTPTGWNGHFVEAMAGAYAEFQQTDRLPVSVNVEGISYGRGAYLSAACMVLRKIIDEPATWQDEEVEYISAAGPDNDANNTFDEDEMTLQEFVQVTEAVYEYAERNGRFPNYHTVEQGHTDDDGSVYDIKLPINSIAVMFSRVFAYYAQNSELPQTVSTWPSDFLRATANCQVADAAVVSAMQTATSGKTSAYDKAKAIFEYARDEWEWENYANTSKGAVGTINAAAGNCCDLSHAIVAMSRAAGIPARYRHAQCQYAKSVIGHVMAELYVDGQWYLCDASNNSNTFGGHEAWKYMAVFNGRYNELPF